jgi:hypothetical protein
MNAKQINTAIMQGTWTNDELNSMIEAIKWNRAQLARSVKYTLKPGIRVRFNSQKMGGVIDGTVKDVKVKYATVDTGRGTWRVPINMLETA